jgi:hypothetical protein
MYHGNRYACNNRGTAGDGVFYAVNDEGNWTSQRVVSESQ